ncbi:unnamed protein product [Orchesella dallaii]|uniref:Ionotropic glutamate receptor C-terminal domain-containing protein n=1 Tax=Orchesella dallaii TaxID=48710 RepID=A0ABP1RMP0_9HEXA
MVDHNNISSDLQIAWAVLDPLLNYYGGISPFTIQSSIISKSITDSERYQNQYKNRGSTRRHSNCTIQLQLICQDIRDGTAIWRKEFVWYIISTTGTKCVGKFPTDIRLQSYPSLYFGISNFRRIFMLCWSCRPIVTSLPKDNAINTIIGYLYLWKKLHRNQNKVLVGINDDLPVTSSISRWSCNIHKTYIVPVHTCVYFTMWKALNFTNINTHSPITHELSSHKEGLIFSRVPITRSTTKMALSENFEFISYALHIQSYYYLMVVEQVPTNWRAIIQPFDSLTWIFIVVTISVVGYVLCLEVTTLHGKLCQVEFQVRIPLPSASKSWFKVEFAAVALLIHQSVPINQFMNKSPKSLFVLWCFWSFVAVTLNQFYEGSLFSFLSTTVSPSVPQTLDEVLRTNTLMFTQTSGQNSVNGTPTNKYSILKESVLSEMIDNDPKKNDSAYGELYRKIKLIWIGYNVNTTLEFQKNGWIIDTLTGVAIKVPHKFFLVDTVAQVTFFRAYLRLITQKWLSKPVTLSTLVSRHGWVIKQNYMYEILKRKLAQLYESGLYVRWEVFCMDSEIVVSVKQSTATLGLRNLKNGVSASNLFQYVFCSEQIELAVAEEIAIGMDMLAILFMYSAVCILFSSVILFHEIVKALINL